MFCFERGSRSVTQAGLKFQKSSCLSLPETWITRPSFDICSLVAKGEGSEAFSQCWGAPFHLRTTHYLSNSCASLGVHLRSTVRKCLVEGSVSWKRQVRAEHGLCEGKTGPLRSSSGAWANHSELNTVRVMALSQEANDQQRLFSCAGDHRWHRVIGRQLASTVKLKGREG